MKSHPRVICIGAAVQDVFLLGKIFRSHRDEDGDRVQEFELGSKNDVEEVIFSTGGGATNAAVTFARQGMHAFYMGKVGNDVAGRAVLEALHQDDVDTSLVAVADKTGTGYSVLLLAPSGERTILTYRGASTHYDLKTHDFHDQKADWIYLSSFEGNFEALETIFEYAKSHDIKIAMNPGKKELAEKTRLKKLLPGLSVLSANKQEMQMLFRGDSLVELATVASETVPVVIVTDGPGGAAACDGQKIVRAGMYENVPVVDRTGAGDAFSSGFVAMIAKGETLEHAIRFASANSTSVVSKIGAKTGILHEGVRLHEMPMRIRNLKQEAVA